jgi:hypothetical protein
VSDRGKHSIFSDGQAITGPRDEEEQPGVELTILFLLTLGTKKLERFYLERFF